MAISLAVVLFVWNGRPVELVDICPAFVLCATGILHDLTAEIDPGAITGLTCCDPGSRGHR